MESLRTRNVRGSLARYSLLLLSSNLVDVPVVVGVEGDGDVAAGTGGGDVGARTAFLDVVLVGDAAAVAAVDVADSLIPLCEVAAETGGTDSRWHLVLLLLLLQNNPRPSSTPNWPAAGCI